MAEKKESTAQGKVAKVLTGNNGPYGVALESGEAFRRSNFGDPVDFSSVKAGDYVEIAYYESSGKNYAKALKIVDSPAAELAHEQVEDDVFVPETPAAEVVQEAATAQPGASQQATPQKKTWAEQQAEKDNYWTNKTGLDMDKLKLDREKFEFEKQRADNIAKQAAIKTATDVVLAAFQANPDPGVSPTMLVNRIYKTAFFLNRPIEVGFKAALDELRKTVGAGTPEQRRAADGRSPG